MITKTDKLNNKSVLNFGKYKGKTVGDIIHKDPDYILWCLKTEIFKLKNKTYNLLERVVLSKRHTSYNTIYEANAPLKSWRSEEDNCYYEERIVQRNKMLYAYNDDKTTTVYGGGPCGPMEFDEFGEMM